MSTDAELGIGCWKAAAHTETVHRPRWTRRLRWSFAIGFELSGTESGTDPENPWRLDRFTVGRARRSLRSYRCRAGRPPLRGLHKSTTEQWRTCVPHRPFHRRDRRRRCSTPTRCSCRNSATWSASPGALRKTSVKDLIRAVCSEHMSNHTSAASFNNEFGIPLTLLGAPVDSGVVVIEMGARDSHIEFLCRIARPTIGVVTGGCRISYRDLRVDRASGSHQGRTCRSAPRKLLVLNVDDPNVAAMSSVLEPTGPHLRSQRRRRDLQRRGSRFGPQTDLHPPATPGEETSWELRAPTWPRMLPLPPRRRGHRSTYRCSPRRTHLAADLAPPDGGSLPSRLELSIINDSYNANPTSIVLLSTLSRINAATDGSAILGVMAELANQQADHLSIIERARRRCRQSRSTAPLYGAETTHVGDIASAVGLVGELGHDVGAGEGKQGGRVGASLHRIPDGRRRITGNRQAVGKSLTSSIAENLGNRWVLGARPKTLPGSRGAGRRRHSCSRGR